MDAFDTRLPPPLAELAELVFEDEAEDPDDAEHEPVDLEVYPAFLAADEGRDWIQAWTGNTELGGAEFRFFGQDGSGGIVGLWLARAGAPLVEQPVVHFGSEGELLVVAADVRDFLWLLAAGYGPRDVAGEHTRFDRVAHPRLTAFAEAHAGGPRRSAQAVLERGSEAFPNFAADVRALCRYA